MTTMAMPLHGRPPIRNPPKQNFRRFRLMIIYKPPAKLVVALAEFPTPLFLYHPPPTSQPATFLLRYVRIRQYSSLGNSGYHNKQRCMTRRQVSISTS